MLRSTPLPSPILLGVKCYSSHEQKEACELIAQGLEICTLKELKPLHQVLPDRPHPRPLAVNIHRNSEQETRHLDASDGKEDLLRPVGLEPICEEEREDEAVEDVCSDN